jgi:hypothetical protein
VTKRFMLFFPRGAARRNPPPIIAPRR